MKIRSLIAGMSICALAVLAGPAMAAETVTYKALDKVAGIQACLVRLQSGQYDATSPNGLRYASEGPLDCATGSQLVGDHQKYALIGVTSFDDKGQRLQAAGDFVDRDTISVFQHDKAQISIELDGKSYMALIGPNGLEQYDPETDADRPGAVMQGPTAGVGGQPVLVMIRDLPQATQQALAEVQADAVKVQTIFAPALSGTVN